MFVNMNKSTFVFSNYLHFNLFVYQIVIAPNFDIFLYPWCSTVSTDTAQSQITNLLSFVTKLEVNRTPKNTKYINRYKYNYLQYLQNLIWQSNMAIS